MNHEMISALDRELVYLDHAATSLKPQGVIDRVSYYLSNENGSPNRGAHRLSLVSTQRYHESKAVVKGFLKAPVDWEVVYTKNATEAFNLLAMSLPQPCLKAGEEIVLTVANHHSNLIPWQRLARQRQAKLVYLYVDAQGNLPESELRKINEKTRIIAFPLIANALGNVMPVKLLTDRAKAVGALTVVDGAQAVGHLQVDLSEMACDYFVFSAHKLYAPTGIGVLMASADQLEVLEPFLLGGDMISYVTETDATFLPVPQRLEAGTQNVMGAVGLMAAIGFIENYGLEAIIEHEATLTRALMGLLSQREDIEVYGPVNSDQRGAIVSFNVKGVHPHDVASILDSRGIAIRAGHHCCQPLMQHLGLGATCRASFGVYNDLDDIHQLSRALDLVQEVFGHA